MDKLEKSGKLLLLWSIIVGALPNGMIQLFEEENRLDVAAAGELSKIFMTSTFCSVRDNPSDDRSDVCVVDEGVCCRGLTDMELYVFLCYRITLGSQNVDVFLASRCWLSWIPLNPKSTPPQRASDKKDGNTNCRESRTYQRIFLDFD